MEYSSNSKPRQTALFPFLFTDNEVKIEKVSFNGWNYKTIARANKNITEIVKLLQILGKYDKIWISKKSFHEGNVLIVCGFKT